MTDASDDTKKNWSQLRELVKRSFRRISELPIDVPFSTNFAPLKNDQGEEIGVRLYFLGALDNSLENTLVYADIVDNGSIAEPIESINYLAAAKEDEEMQIDSSNRPSIDSNPMSGKLLWKPLLDTTDKSSGDQQTINKPELSLQEKLQLERKRMMAAGLTNYEFHSGKKRFLFVNSGDLYYFDDDGQPPYLPKVVKNKLTKGAKINPSFCPSNPDLVAYVNDGDLYVCNIITGDEIALTQLSKDFPKSQMTAGLPSYVVQEEFSRYEGFWWGAVNPDKQPEAEDEIKYQIMFELVDESWVDLFKISTWDGGVEEYRFPRPGQTNATSSLKIGAFQLNTKSNSLSNGQMLSIPGVMSLKQLYPSFEYFVRAQFVTYDSIVVQQMDREQKTLVYSLVSLANHFKPQILFYENIAPHWAHVSDILHFTNFEKTKSLRTGDELEFLITSQRSGFRHLYKVRCQIADGLVLGVPGKKFENELSLLNDLLHSRLLSTVQLTSGNWEVSDKESWLDKINRLLYFTACKESPLETHLYVLDYQREDREMQKLTTSGYSHSGIVFNENHSSFVSLQSSISEPPIGFVYRKTKKTSHEISRQLLPQFQRIAKLIDNKNRNLELLNQNFADEHLPTFAKPELFSYQLKESGDVVYGLIFKPDFMQAGVKYPVLLEVYGGPGVQLVSNSYRSTRLLRRHLLASQGYVVCAFDCRGSSHRGVKFEGHLRDRLGQVEVNDQVEVLQYLASTTNYIDLNRVAVHGWSYGGYLSLLCLAQRPDFFKICVAGAPVTNWELYDTGYTERYLGLPQEKEEQYRLGSVLSHVPKLPSDVNRLLIMHGMMDENVHFQHSVELIQELIKAGKPYQLQVFPYERHSLRNQAAREHYLAYLLWFLNNYL